ncbi:MAG: acetate/propionate family kinase [Burkholderiales bacterium]
MSESILVLNAGSSSIKFALYKVHGARLGERVLGGQVAGIRDKPQLNVTDANGRRSVRLQRAAAPATAPAQAPTQALGRLLDWLQTELAGERLRAIGHRVVHGGERFAAPVRIDDEAIRALQSLVPIARLHQPYEIDAILALCRRRPGMPQVACFDTAFHRTLPTVAQLFPLPRAIIDSGVRRYGFHGLSYAYIATRLPALLADHPIAAERARVVVAHLGSGSSLCALRGGQSIATTMGFTALDGLMMATRAGSVDPGILLYLMQERGMSAQQVSDMLYHRSGLLGVSGKSANMSELLACDDADAREAVALYVYCLVREAGALIACLGGIDGLVFTAGIGEHVAPVRERVCAELSWLGIVLDAEANARHQTRISAAASAIPVWVVPTDEELMIARETLRLTAAPP